VGFHLVAPSEWIAQLARDTGVVSNPDVTVIPNGIDTSYYTPDSSGGTYIETDQTNILFGAVSATSDPRKGYDLLAAALRGLPDSSDYACIVFGDDNPDLCKIGIQTESVGHLPEKDLIGLYGDCDVMVVPSRQESFGQTALEALACGTPVVAFNATGLRDIVVHKETGYLADPYDPADLRAGIEWVTHDEERQIRLARAARIDAEERFEIETTAGQYAELYDRVA
jgi:glycosyltransferase involved in cell wall biosynthesis